MRKLLIFLFIHCVAFSQWIPINNGLPTPIVQSLAFTGNNLYAGAISPGALYYSSNNGENWTNASFNVWINCLHVSGNNFFAGTNNNGVYLSTNNGVNWNQTSLINQDIRCLTSNGNTVFAGSDDGNGIFISTNNGSNWQQTSLNNRYVSDIAVISGNIYAACFDGYGIYKSTNNGLNWSQYFFSDAVYSLTSIGGKIFAGTFNNGIYYSTNSGANWVQTALNRRNVRAMITYGSSIMASNDTLNISGFYFSPDSGNTWIQKSEGLGNRIIYDLLVVNNYIFAGTQYGVMRRHLSELVGYTIMSEELPEKFSLSQNYPNPFNPATNIEFSIPIPGFVNLTIYDALGREIETIVNDELKPGTYKADWNASKYPSGVYFYKLNNGEFSETKKMILVK